MRSATPFGITAVEPQIDLAAVHAHVQRVIAKIAPHDLVERFEGLGATVIPGDARFVGPHELVVSCEASERRISARWVIIATGSSPPLPKIDGLAGMPHFTNETLFDNPTLPEHLLILGGGPIGIEMAQAHRRLGSKVTVIERSRCLSKDDEEHATLLLRLSVEGVSVRQETGVTAVRHGPHGPHGIVLSLDEGGQMSEIEGSHLLVATGRSTRVDALGPD